MPTSVLIAGGDSRCRGRPYREALELCLNGLNPLPTELVHAGDHGVGSLVRAYLKNKPTMGERVTRVDYRLGEETAHLLWNRCVIGFKPDVLVVFRIGRYVDDLIGLAKANAIPVKQLG